LAGEFSRNQVLNGAIQGSSFHWLLTTLVELQKWLNKYKMKSVILGQIHDSLLSDVHEKEKDDFLCMVKWLVEKALPKKYPWINAPLSIEAEIVPLGASWWEKRDFDMSTIVI